MLVLLIAVATGAWADELQTEYTSTPSSALSNVTVSDDMEVTIASGVTVTINNGLTIASGKTLTVTGPGTLVVNGANGSDGYYAWEDEGDGGNGDNGGAAISGNITVDGATVIATGGRGGNGGWSAQGTGGNGGNGANAFSGTLTYKGGVVNATGGDGGIGARSEYYEWGDNGSNANAFANNVDFSHATVGYILTNGSSEFTGSVTGKYKVVIIPAVAVPVNAGATDEYWATFYSDASNYQAPSGTQVFMVKLDGTTITMTEVSGGIVMSGQGVVLKNATGSSITMTPTTSDASGDWTGNNSLKGTMTSITNPGNAYVLNKGAGGVGFYRLSDTGTIGANKAYLVYSAGAREFFGFGETTGVNEELRMKNEESATAPVYDLQGRRVSQPTKGLYIVNGKKVVIK